MKIDMNIDVHHVTRVEGHGNIKVRVQDGELKEAMWQVVETPRFFEAMLRGKSHDLAPTLTSRICGICSIGHTLASLRTVERAMKIEIPRTAKLLRMLGKHAETLQSHFLHLFFLVAPDFFNVDSVIPITQSHPEIAGVALRLKGLANDMSDLLTGRTTHPVSLVVGGLSTAPDKKQLAALKQAILDRVPDVETTIAVFQGLTLPDFVRETEFVALKGENEYPWIGGDLISTDGVVKPEDEYRAMTNEYKEDFCTTKFTRLSRKSFAAGALARLNNNFKFLHPKAQELSKSFGLEPVNHNPYMNNIAQLVESLHCALESLEIIDELLDDNYDNIRTEYEVQAGEGVGAVEVPRGILYHNYQIDDKGFVRKANCIIPTTQNNANIHHDMPELVKHEVAKGSNDKEITKLCEMLVRAYDPCISCSVH
ncbi:MAG: Ni/Fe hydrogenase subunit alpha [Planctomycetes bacterium]|nr:Ni/Fe hydrogenase subunit alpha [Planctomycetota bacterium]